MGEGGWGVQGEWGGGGEECGGEECGGKWGGGWGGQWGGSEGWNAKGEGNFVLRLG